ncbi:MAG: DUF1684 domain-containing protein [Thermoanaerobaculaceae bacterium]|nr:DUF1684 domain-containing protein [Thermoanaerobaculaceae bacterium]TAM45493.1 MAG: DUF1684 domain-containing protein [Acidobacteriota bacterium]
MRLGTSRPRALPLSGGVLAGLLLAFGGCHAPLPTPELTYRRERAQAVKAALPAAAAAEFKGLRFYPFDPAYRFQAMIEPVDPPEPLEIAASDGSRRPAHRVGRVRLRFPHGEAVLSVFQLDDIRAQHPDHLFLPFRDAGAGTATYGAGRYVDVERLPGGVVSLDFNHAYNPDCAYGISGQCPITPAENTVTFAIEAGEMMPPGH